MDAQTEKTLKTIASHTAKKRAISTVNLLSAYAFLVPVAVLACSMILVGVDYLRAASTGAIGLFLLVFFVLSILWREDMIEYFFKRYYSYRLNLYKELLEKEEVK
jgi:hypothetical protein